MTSCPQYPVPELGVEGWHQFQSVGDDLLPTVPGSGAGGGGMAPLRRIIRPSAVAIVPDGRMEGRKGGKAAHFRITGYRLREIKSKVSSIVTECTDTAAAITPDSIGGHCGFN